MDQKLGFEQQVGPPPTDIQRELIMIPAVLLAVAVAAMPFVSNLFGLWWGYIVPLLPGVLLVLTLWFTTSDGPHSSRFIYVLSIAFPTVERYLKKIEKVTDANRNNIVRYSNMKSLLTTYNFPTKAAMLAPPIYMATDQPEIVKVKVLAEEASKIIRDIPEQAKHFPYPARLVTSLMVLYARHYPEAVTPEEVDNARHFWSHFDKDGSLSAFTAIVQRHDAFRTSGYEFTEIELALVALRDKGIFFTLPELIDQLQGAPTKTVADMISIAELYRLGTVAPEDQATIAQALSGISHIKIYEKAAAEIAVRIDTNDATRTARQLELLYCDHFGYHTLGLWQTLAPNEKNELGQRLCEAGTLKPTVVCDGGESEANKLWIYAVQAVLNKISDFDINLVRDAMVCFDELWGLATAFATDAYDNGLPKSKCWSGYAPSEAFVTYLTEVAAALPYTRADIPRLKTPELAVNLICHVANELIETSTEASERANLQNLAFVSAGLYLLGGHRHPELGAELAHQVRKGGRDTIAAQVLLARMWRRRQKVLTGQASGVPLMELFSQWPKWLDEASKEYGEPLMTELRAAINQQVRHGSWPTTLPLEWMFNMFARNIIEASREHAQSEIRVIKHKVKMLQRAAGNEITDTHKMLIEKINRLDPTAADADREQMVEDVIAASDAARTKPIEEVVNAVNALEAIDRDVAQTVHKLEIIESNVVDQVDHLVSATQALDKTDHEVAQTVHQLELVDGDVVTRVDSLVAADNALRNAVDRLTGSIPSTSGCYVLTWKTKSGPLADLVDYLVKSDQDKYKFKYYSPYARIGTIPPDQDFAAFFAKFAFDLGQAYRDKETILPNYEWDAQPNVEGVISVQQIGLKEEIAVP